MRMNDQDYFRSCIARERQLAHLLGHMQIEECYESAGTLWDGNRKLPQWTRDWQACGPLLAQYHLCVAHEEGAVRIGSTRVQLTDHPTLDRALMYGIVKELIFLLEHHKLVPASA